MDNSFQTGYSRKFSKGFDSLSESSLPIGEMIQVEVDGKKYISFLRGAMPLNYLLIDVPSASGDSLSLSYHSPIVIRFLDSGTVFGFKVNFLRMHTDPLFVVTDYPSAIEGYNLRKKRRVRVIVPVTISVRNSPEEYEGVILDLSDTGAMIAISSDYDLEKGSAIDLNAEFAGWRSYVEHPKRREKAKELFTNGASDEKRSPGDGNREAPDQKVIQKREINEGMDAYYDQSSEDEYVQRSKMYEDFYNSGGQGTDYGEKSTAPDKSANSDKNRPFTTSCTIKNIRPSLEGKSIMGLGFSDDEDGLRGEMIDFYLECASFRIDENLDKKMCGEPLTSGHDVVLEKKGKKMTASLRGWKLDSNGYLLIEPPLNHKMSMDMQTGHNITARFQKSGSIIGIMTRFGGILKKTRLWIFHFQSELIEHSIRDGVRYDCLIPTTIFKQGRDDRYIEVGRGMISNLSMCGVKLMTKENLFISEGEYLNVTFSLGKFGSISNENIKVVRSQKLKGCFSYSGFFEILNVDYEEKLKRFFEYCKDWLPE